MKFSLKIFFQKRLQVIFAIFVTGTTCLDVGLSQTIGLIPSTNSLGRAEAITASTYGTDALFYNPAALVNNRFSVSLASIEAYQGLDEGKISSSDLNNQGDLNLEDYFRLLGDQDQVYASTTARAIDITFSYFGASSFARGYASAEKDGAIHNYSVGSDVGAIAGFGVRLWKLSLGYAQYGLHRIGVASSPTEAQIQTINQAILDDTFDESTVPIRDFTDVTYGSARGHNVGMLYCPWDENISGIGISVLNAGSTEFKDKTFLDREDAQQLEQEVKEEATLYNIDLKTPQTIPESINVGVQAGYDGGEDNIFQVRAGIDFNDISEDSSSENFGASYDLGLNLPNPIALALSWPIFDTDWAYYAAGEKPKGDNHIVHMGLLNFKTFGGYRHKSYISRGVGIGFHFGVDRLVSVLKLELEAFETKRILQSDHIPQRGFRGILGLTLVL